MGRGVRFPGPALRRSGSRAIAGVVGSLKTEGTSRRERRKRHSPHRLSFGASGIGGAATAGAENSSNGQCGLDLRTSGLAIDSARHMTQSWDWHSHDALAVTEQVEETRARPNTRRIEFAIVVCRFLVMYRRLRSPSRLVPWKRIGVVSKVGQDSDGLLFSAWPFRRLTVVVLEIKGDLMRRVRMHALPPLRAAGRRGPGKALITNYK